MAPVTPWLDEQRNVTAVGHRRPQRGGRVRSHFQLWCLAGKFRLRSRSRDGKSSRLYATQHVAASHPSAGIAPRPRWTTLSPPASCVRVIRGAACVGMLDGVAPWWGAWPAAARGDSGTPGARHRRWCAIASRHCTIRCRIVTTLGRAPDALCSEQRGAAMTGSSPHAERIVPHTPESREGARWGSMDETRTHASTH